MSDENALPEGVHVFERGWLSSNSILFVGSSLTALVDSGYACHADQTMELVDHMLGKRSLDLLLNTHLHSDHCGGNAALQERFTSMETRIPPGEAPLVQNWNEEKLSYLATGQICPPFKFDDLLIPGTQVALGFATWEIHGAPGHDPHSIMLFEPISRTLISADALWESGFGIVFPELNGEPSFDEVALTLDLIERLEAKRVIPGHGRMFSDVKASLKIARSRLDYFACHPSRHARYAVKVLLKFLLLERKSIGLSDWHAWIRQTPYLRTINEKFFPSCSLHELTSELLDELVAAGSACVERGQIRDI